MSSKKVKVPKPLTEEDIKEIKEGMCKKMQRLRRLRGLTLQKLAEYTGISFQNLQKYECNKSNVTSIQLHKIARALCVSTEYFFNKMETHTEGLSVNELSLLCAYRNSSEEAKKKSMEFLKKIK